MIANVKARFSKGVLTPLEPLDLEEGRVVVVSIEDVQVAGQGHPAIADGGGSMEGNT